MFRFQVRVILTPSTPQRLWQKVLQRSRKRQEEWWPVCGQASIHLMQYANYSFTESTLSAVN